MIAPSDFHGIVGALEEAHRRAESAEAPVSLVNSRDGILLVPTNKARGLAVLETVHPLSDI